MKKSPPYVALMVRTSAKTYREILNGILRYNHCAEPWSLLMVQEREAEDIRIRLAGNKFSGVIIDETMKEFGNLRHFRGTPLITIESVRPNSLSNPRRLCLLCDNNKIGRFAAQHLHKLGHKNFAYVPAMLSQPWSIARGKSFTEEIKLNGKSCARFTPPPPDDPQLTAKDFSLLGQWLKSLPKPCAVFAANDLRARNVLDAANQASISVPREISILGCDDEEIVCSTAKPEITSIRFNTEEIGFSAAQKLDRMIRSGKPLDIDERILTYGPASVVSRKSTARAFLSDPLVEKALVYIQLNAVDGLDVSELASELGISRRTLEKRFRDVLGRSPYEEAIQYRLDLACRMIQDTTFKTADIAERCGFPSQSHFETMFKRKLNITVAQYRHRAHI